MYCSCASSTCVFASRVRAREERGACEITFPRLLGYRYDVADGDLQYKFTDDSRLAFEPALHVKDFFRV